MRVVVGSFEGLSSPLVPVEPFNLFDVELRHHISFNVEEGHNTLFYVVDGSVRVRADGRAQTYRSNTRSRCTAIQDVRASRLCIPRMSSFYRGPRSASR